MRSLSLLLFTLYATFVPAQDDSLQSFSLAEAQAFGIKNNLTLKNAHLDYEEAQKKIGEITATGMPQINASGNFNHNIEIPTQVIPARAFDPTAPADQYVPVQFGIANTANYSINATQMIFDGTFFVGLQASKSYRELREKGIAKTEIEIKDRIAIAYYNVLIVRENERIFRANIETLENQFNTVSKMNQQGMLEDLEVDQIDYILSDARKRYETTGRQVTMALQMLNFAMGREINLPVVLTDSLETIYKSYNEAELLDKVFSVENNIDYQLLSTQEHIQELVIRADKVSRLPKIDAQYFYGRNAFSDQYTFGRWYPNSFVGLSANMPIFTSLQNTRKLQQSKIKLNRIQNEKILLEDNLQLQVNSARTAYIDALEQYKTENKKLSLARKIFETTSAKQVNGMASSLDVTIANNQYLETQGRYIGALYRILEAKSSLDKSLNNY